MRKIAIIHDWFTVFSGSEKVIEQLLQIFPDADLFSLIDFLPEKDRGFFKNKSIHTTFLQKAPFIRKNYRLYLPLMPLAVEQLSLVNYDLIISNCHAISKGVISGPEQLHISYIHSPIRYAWDLQDTYLETSGVKNVAARFLLHYIRLWDLAASKRPDRLVANSGFIARRIQKFYRRQSVVIYPPVDTDFFTLREQKEDFFLTASRFVPYKRIDIIIKAFQNMPDKKLIVIGEGPEARKLNRISAPNITWLGFQSACNLRDYLQSCRAFVFAAKEDFGIIPLEAQACGTPVIAFGEGGVAETVNGKDSQEPTGIFFSSQTEDAIISAVLELDHNPNLFRPEYCRKNAERFSIQRFRNEFFNFVLSAWEDFMRENANLK